MGIDVYLRWPKMTDEQQAAQYTGFEVSERAGGAGYLREAYHGEPYATLVLVPESWDQDTYDKDLEGAIIPAATLRERLPAAIETAKERARIVYKQADADDPPMVAALTAFVALAESMEKAHGRIAVCCAY